jgi:uncharacterized protein
MSISTFETIRVQPMINLVTFRKNGQPVPTPVAVSHADGKLYIITGVKTGKIKRLRHNPLIKVAPCDWSGKLLGDMVDAQARVLTPAESKAIGKRVKFNTPAPLMFIFNRLRDLRQGGNIYVEICL